MRIVSENYDGIYGRGMQFPTGGRALRLGDGLRFCFGEYGQFSVEKGTVWDFSFVEYGQFSAEK